MNWITVRHALGARSGGVLTFLPPSRACARGEAFASGPGPAPSIGVRGKPSRAAGVARNCGQPRKLRPIFRICSTAPRCAVSSEAHMTPNPLLRHAVGGGMRSRNEKLLRVVANDAQDYVRMTG